MKELFIPYTEALALKELGFNEKCLSAYTNRGKFHQTSSDYWDNDSIKMIKEYTTIKLKVLAPLYSQVFKWFREKYNIDVHIQKNEDVFIAKGGKKYIYFLNGFGGGDTYEQAELECIRKLIEIVKKEQKK